MANKVKSLLGGPGFYAVLALCVLAVGASVCAGSPNSRK